MITGPARIDPLEQAVQRPRRGPRRRAGHHRDRVLRPRLLQGQRDWAHYAPGRRQRVGLPLHRFQQRGPRSRGPPPAHVPLHAAAQRQSRALQPYPGRGVPLRPTIHQRGTTKKPTGPMAHPLQLPPTPHRQSGQPTRQPRPHPRKQRHTLIHLVRVDHLHHPPMTKGDHPAPRTPGNRVAGFNIQHQTPLASRDRDQVETLQPDEQIIPITAAKSSAAGASGVRHRPRSLKTAGREVHPSSRTSPPTRNPQPTPAHPHPTLKNL